MVLMENKHSMILISLFRNVPFLKDDKLGYCVYSACNNPKDVCSSQGALDLEKPVRKQEAGAAESNSHCVCHKTPMTVKSTCCKTVKSPIY